MQTLLFRRGTRGFTLIELLVVIAIIGLLASVVLASLNSARQKARDARRKADLKQMQLAVELYYDRMGSYPTTDGWTSDAGCAGTLCVALVTNTQLLPSIPQDPSGLGNYFYALGNWTVTPQLGTGRYCLYAQLENPSAADTATYTNAPFRTNTNYGLDYALCN